MSTDNEKKIIEELKKTNLGGDGLKSFIDFSSSAASYGFITGNSQQYIRDLQVAKVLGEKFSKSGIFNSAQNAKEWLNTRMEVNPNNLNQVFRRLQGDGAGEVDIVRKINGSLRGIIHKAELVKDESGRFVSNFSGYDVVVKNRFTQEIVEKIQVKSNWSPKNADLKNTINKFVNSADYNEKIVLAGPKELTDMADNMNLKNPKMTFHTTGKNRASAERLMKLTEKGKFEVTLKFGDVASKVGQGALIGAGVAIGVSALTNYLEFKKGSISAKDAFLNIAKDGSKGGIVGGSLAGLSLLFPPGIIGIGIGIAVGTGLRKIIDIAYGEGEYENILNDMYATNDLSRGYLYFALSTDKSIDFWDKYAGEMLELPRRARIIDGLSKESQNELDDMIKKLEEN